LLDYALDTYVREVVEWARRSNYNIMYEGKKIVHMLWKNAYL